MNLLAAIREENPRSVDTEEVMDEVLQEADGLNFDSDGDSEENQIMEEELERAEAGLPPLWALKFPGMIRASKAFANGIGPAPARRTRASFRLGITSKSQAAVEQEASNAIAARLRARLAAARVREQARLVTATTVSSSLPPVRSSNRTRRPTAKVQATIELAFNFHYSVDPHTRWVKIAKSWVEIAKDWVEIADRWVEIAPPYGSDVYRLRVFQAVALSLGGTDSKVLKQRRCRESTRQRNAHIYQRRTYEVPGPETSHMLQEFFDEDDHGMNEMNERQERLTARAEIAKRRFIGVIIVTSTRIQETPQVECSCNGPRALVCTSLGEREDGLEPVEIVEIGDKGSHRLPRRGRDFPGQQDVRPNELVYTDQMFTISAEDVEYA
ncbi:MAG: hypothetical protein M1816_008207 [Peltula sp. TS41687]|nr:MAG: hypothetical protein M1816_008207 [Peltula sp. TS41687]